MHDRLIPHHFCSLSKSLPSTSNSVLHLALKACSFLCSAISKNVLLARDPVSQQAAWHLPQHLKPNTSRILSAFPAFTGWGSSPSSLQTRRLACLWHPLSSSILQPILPREAFSILPPPFHPLFCFPVRCAMTIAKTGEGHIIPSFSMGPACLRSRSESLAQAMWTHHWPVHPPRPQCPHVSCQEPSCDAPGLRLWPRDSFIIPSHSLLSLFPASELFPLSCCCHSLNPSVNSLFPSLYVVGTISFKKYLLSAMMSQAQWDSGTHRSIRQANLLLSLMTEGERNSTASSMKPPPLNSSST